MDSRSDMDSRSVFKETRKSHRGVLRAVNADDRQWSRASLYALYDPQSGPLVHATSGPCVECLVPMVDAALLTAAKGRLMHSELVDNLQKVGESFGLTPAAMGHLNESFDAARRAQTDPAELMRMESSLDAAGFSHDSGLCIPGGMRQMQAFD